jgi:hypothetical protein
MDKKQAGLIIKEALDKSLSKGVFENMQDVAALLTAFQILIKEDKKNES